MASRLRPRRLMADEGFTLIEALVALAVVAVSLTAIGAVIAVSSRGTRSLEQHVALTEITRMVVATLPRSEQIPADGMSGDILGHRWRVDVRPFGSLGVPLNSDAPWVPRTVVVQVRSPAGAIQTVETVRLLQRAGR